MADKRWKQFERTAADLIGGKRFWANSGEAIDCESPQFVAQCKLVKSLSLAALSELCATAEEQAEAKKKIGLVVTKVSKRQLPTIVCMTARQFRHLLIARVERAEWMDECVRQSKIADGTACEEISMEEVLGGVAEIK
jgi:hypothetical protein